jgi:23S rRNA (cytidine1920-2'-O)/16S rRNA (cytidine1409-2'-O)-methyltransferase
MNAKTDRKRLDVLLVERGLAESSHKAQAMILAGEVEVDQQRADKAGLILPETAHIEVHSRQQKYASRGGIKLEGALVDFHISPAGRTCLDIGASTGGFTDCLLQNQAARVYAVDVNTDQLAWKLRGDPRVTRIEKNARELVAQDLPDAVDLVVVDVSFISVTRVLTGASACAKVGADLLVLVKPQFELERQHVGKGGIVREKELHDKAVAAVQKAMEAAGLQVLGLAPSRLPGAEGNQEYFLHARKPAGVESR